MTWSRGSRFGSHSERAVSAPSTTWFLAEGATHGAFDTFYLIENPNDTVANVQITYLLPDGRPPIVLPYDVDAHTQTDDLGGRTARARRNRRVRQHLRHQRRRHHRRTRDVSHEPQHAVHGRSRQRGRDDSRRALVLRGGRDRIVLRHVPAARESRRVGSECDRALSAARRRGASGEVLQPGPAKPHDDQRRRRGRWAGGCGDCDGGGRGRADRRGAFDVLAGTVGIGLDGSAQFRGRHRDRHGVGRRRRRAGRRVPGADLRADRQHVDVRGERARHGPAGRRRAAGPRNRAAGRQPHQRRRSANSPSSRRRSTAASACSSKASAQPTTTAQIVVERATYTNDAAGTVWGAGSNSLATRIR